jgi:hypothetical protein
MLNKKEILKKRLTKAESHFNALSDYYSLIQQLLLNCPIYQVDGFTALKIQEKAILDAYLKRFSSLQDFLGAKIFPLLVEVSGFGTSKMSEVLYYIEKEEIIDDLSHWVELREIRNELEHDYPDDLAKALQDLQFCIDSFKVLKKYYFNAANFAEKYL